MLKLQQISIKPIGKTVSIRPHFRKHEGQAVFVFGHSRGSSINEDNLQDVLTKSKAHLKVDLTTGKVIFDRSNSR